MSLTPMLMPPPPLPVPPRLLAVVTGGNRKIGLACSGGAHTHTTSHPMPFDSTRCLVSCARSRDTSHTHAPAVSSEMQRPVRCRSRSIKCLSHTLSARLMASSALPSLARDGKPRMPVSGQRTPQRTNEA